MLAAEDRVAIHELLAFYGVLIDERQFTRTHELFTDDAVYDVSDFDAGVHIGWERIAQMWRESEGLHPLAHHVTNVVVTEDDDGIVRAISKVIGVRADGKVGSVTYRDILVKGANGWRMRERIAVARRADQIPPHS